MHYRNGREAKNGDKVVQLTFDGDRIVGFGVLYDATPNNNYCNGYLAAPSLTQLGMACLVDCLHVEDIQQFIKEKGLEKRPPVKSSLKWNK